jgi:hypothetical protein
MSNGFDQHLASRLTSSHVLWVVLEPANADAVLTDALDTAFWSWMLQTYPARPGGTEATALRPDKRLPPPAAAHRGPVFLVDPRARLVLWSTYESPRDASPAELDRAATRITKQLKTAVERN